MPIRRTSLKLIAVLLIAIWGGAALACAQTQAGAARGATARFLEPRRGAASEMVITRGIAGWWPFDESQGLVAAGAAGTNTGHLVGFTSPRWLQGQLGRALAFDGASSNAVVISNAPALNPGQQISLSAWIYSYTAGSAQPETIISKDAGGLSQYSLSIEKQGLVRFTLGASILTGGTKIVPNTWTHVLASYDGRIMRVFINGTAEPGSLGRSGSIAAAEAPVRIGSTANAKQPNAFNGLLDDVRIYARALNFAQAARLYREGIHNSNSEFMSHMQLANYGDVYSVDTGMAVGIQTGLAQTWWQAYLAAIESSATPPGTVWKNACGVGIDDAGRLDGPGRRDNAGRIDDAGRLLECFFKKNPHIAESIVWREADTNSQTVSERPYIQWKPLAKKQLASAFYYAFQWMKGGLQSFNGFNLIDPPVNQFTQPDAAPAITEFDPDAAWHLYVNTVAQSLAVEIGGFVPWSVTGYSKEELRLLFDSEYVVSIELASSNVDDPSIPLVFGYVPAGMTMDAPPTTYFKFLVDQNMIRGNHKTTIEQLINWSRFNLLHITDWTDVSAKAFEGWWDYRGTSPASRVLSGTLGPYRPVPPYPPAMLHNWVDGCHGVVTLYRGLLRTVNIPVDYRIEFGHGMPIWWTVGESLSHGDDVESAILIKDGAQSNKPSSWEQWHKYAKASEYPITLTEFNDWFVGPNQNYLNVGRRAYELLTIKYPDDDLLTMYCYDKAHGLSHAQGTVLASLQGSLLIQVYPLATLEAMGFWNTLASEAAQFGFCGP